MYFVEFVAYINLMGHFVRPMILFRQTILIEVGVDFSEGLFVFRKSLT